MEENNRKGPGIFYAVVGVATLVVAIIGATFAFFSAEANNATSIQGNVAEAGGLFLKVKPLLTTTGIDETNAPFGYTKNLIPLNVNVSATEIEEPYNVSQFESALESSCIDKNGNQVCQVYAVMVANMSATSTIQVRGSLSLASESDNLTWKLIDVPQGEGKAFTYNATSKEATDTIAYSTDATAVKYSLDHSVGAAEAAVGDITVGGNSGKAETDTAIASKELTPSDNTEVYYIMVWLEEIGSAQETPDANKDYTGTVSFSAVDAGGKETGITAVF